MFKLLLPIALNLLLLYNCNGLMSDILADPSPDNVMWDCILLCASGFAMAVNCDTMRMMFQMETRR